MAEKWHPEPHKTYRAAALLYEKKFAPELGSAPNEQSLSLVYSPMPGIALTTFTFRNEILLLLSKPHSLTTFRKNDFASTPTPPIRLDRVFLLTFFSRILSNFTGKNAMRRTKFYLVASTPLSCDRSSSRETRARS